jgi:uncharacterized RmlC-like cupin family protein
MIHPETIATPLKPLLYYGDELEHRIAVKAGDQVYMFEDVPHATLVELCFSVVNKASLASGQGPNGALS